jgi:hypothetical protein
MLKMSPGLYPTAKPTRDLENFSMARVISSNEAKLMELANKLKRANHAKIGIREDIAMLRDILINAEYPTVVTWRDWSLDFVAFEKTKTVNSPDELNNILDDLEKTPQEIAEDMKDELEQKIKEDLDKLYELLKSMSQNLDDMKPISNIP